MKIDRFPHGLQSDIDDRKRNIDDLKRNIVLCKSIFESIRYDSAAELINFWEKLPTASFSSMGSSAPKQIHSPKKIFS